LLSELLDSEIKKYGVPFKKIDLDLTLTMSRSNQWYLFMLSPPNHTTFV